MGIFHQIFGLGKPVNLKEVINAQTYLVDVREPAEFASGSVQGAVNIPLAQVASQLVKFKGRPHIVVFCRSGMRSSQAMAILKQHGITNVTNGGALENVKQHIK